MTYVWFDRHQLIYCVAEDVEEDSVGKGLSYDAARHNFWLKKEDSSKMEVSGKGWVFVSCACFVYTVLCEVFVSGTRWISCPKMSMILVVNVHSPEFQSSSETQVVMKGGLLVCLLASSVGFFISFLGGIFIGDYPLAYITEDYTGPMMN